jgi:hypothetical protein
MHKLIKKYQIPAGSLQMLTSNNQYLSTTSPDIDAIIKKLNKSLGINADGSPIDKNINADKTKYFSTGKNIGS